MLEFFLAFEKIVEKWSGSATMTLTQVAELTKSTIARTVDAVSASLNREFDVNESITQAEAKLVVTALRERIQPQLQARDRKLSAERDAAVKAYDATMERVRVILQMKDFRTAYRTLSYLAGRHEKSLPHEILVCLCGDLLRYGARSAATLPELGSWLRKAIDSAVASGSPEAIEDALDFLDTYREIFVADKVGVGEKIITNALAALTLPVQEIQITSRV